MLQLDAKSFLVTFGQRFPLASVQAWTWEADDDEFGKRAELLLAPAATATVDLQLTQLMLVITERDSSNQDSGSSVVFDALIQFEDGTVVINGADHPFSLDAVRLAIDEFVSQLEAGGL